MTHRRLTAEDYYQAERLMPWNADKLIFRAQVTPTWIDKTDRFWYVNRTPEGKEFVLVDPPQGSREPAFDHARLAAALSVALGKPYEHYKLPFDRFDFVQDGCAVQLDIGDDRWICSLDSLRCERADKPKGAAEYELASPDGKRAAFVKGHNLWVRSLETGEQVQLSSDGEPYYDYAASPGSNLTTVTNRVKGIKYPPVARWCPDSKRILTHRLDQRGVKEMVLLQSVPPDGYGRPIAHSYRYPMPGDEHIAMAQYVVFDVEARAQIRIDAEPVPGYAQSLLELGWAWWDQNSAQVYFIHKDRIGRTLALRAADASTGACRTIVEEHGNTFLLPNHIRGDSPNVRVLGGGAEAIWFSERTGWGHLYLYDGHSGALKNAITSGPWLVRDIVHVDENRRLVYFTAGGREPGRDPYYRQLYRVRLDGSGLQLLTPEDAEHEPAISPSGDYFVDTYSRVDKAPVSVLRASVGRLVRVLEVADITQLQATGWRWPEPFRAKARDGVTDIFGAIYWPSGLQPGHRYPVLDSIYPGPQIIRSNKAFGLDTLGQCEALARLGFIVVTVDGLGTPCRSKAFLDYCYGKMEDAGGLEDHIAALRQLAARYPELDLERVGIYGHSGGGFASAHALLAFPDFFKVAVSSAGNHDQRGYLASWAEHYMGLPVGENWAPQANTTLAGNLKGKLLLICGDMDDNVSPCLTIQLVDALIKANKDFDLLVLPNRNHLFNRGPLADPYFHRKRWDYFVRHLMELEPPEGVSLKGPEG